MPSFHPGRHWDNPWSWQLFDFLNYNNIWQSVDISPEWLIRLHEELTAFINSQPQHIITFIVIASLDAGRQLIEKYWIENYNNKYPRHQIRFERSTCMSLTPHNAWGRWVADTILTLCSNQPEMNLWHLTASSDYFPIRTRCLVDFPAMGRCWDGWGENLRRGKWFCRSAKTCIWEMKRHFFRNRVNIFH